MAERRPVAATLTKGPVGRTLYNQTMPMVWGVLAMVSYNIADTWFVGQLGTAELAAMTFTFPVVMVVFSIAIGLSAGASSVIARAIGEGNAEKVRRLTTDSLILSILIVGLCILIGLLTIDPLFRALGATDDLLPLIRDYMVIWYAGMIFLVVPMVGNGAMRAGGAAGWAGGIMVVSSLINIALDPLLIFGLWGFPRLELEGAAWATVIARVFTLLAALAVLHYRLGLLTRHLPSLSIFTKSWVAVLAIGLPAAATQAIIPVAQGFVTRLMAGHGPEVVAAYGVATRIEYFVLVPVMALSAAIGPFVGQNWSAGLHDRLIRALKLSFLFCMAWGGVFWLVLWASGPVLVPLFDDNPAVWEPAILYLALVPASYGLWGVITQVIAVFNALGSPLAATALSLIRMFGLFVPLAWLGNWLYGVLGLFIGLGVAQALAGILAYLWVRHRCRKSACQRARGEEVPPDAETQDGCVSP